MSGVFISYRRDDGAGWTGHLAQELMREFPGTTVFQDIAAIGLGEDFADAMHRALAKCVVVIVVIGPRWLDARDEAGKRRLDAPDDWVRIELEESLKRPGLRVVPVRVGGAVMPKRADLPESIAALARRNAHEITDNRWAYDFSVLAQALRGMLAPEVSAAGVEGGESDRESATGARAQAAAHLAPGTLQPGTVFRDGDAFSEMVVIPAGRFRMGSAPTEAGRFEAEGPQHEVTIAQPFALGKYAVTFAEWDVFAAAGGTRHVPEDRGWGRDRRSVINVGWEDAQAYAAWVSKQTGKRYRLPSEAEWEYAARAGTRTRYPWGDEPGTNLANFNGSGSQWSAKRTAPVGSFAPNRFGLHDMIGNVWEWTQDRWNETYDGAPGDGTAWETGDCLWRVVRGGSWSSDPRNARVAFRNWDEPALRSGGIGFRLARTL